MEIKSYHKNDFMKLNIFKNILHNKNPKTVTDKFNRLNNISDEICLLDIVSLVYKQYTDKNNFNKTMKCKNIPFIIGVNGSVSSGKSFFADILRDSLLCFPGIKNVSVLSTDCFLYSNEVLKKKKIFDKKGFPISYNWELIIKTLQKIKSNKIIKIPYYNQNISTIDKNKQHINNNQDIIIIEGINILKPPCLSDINIDRILLSDFFDYSLYIDASNSILKNWFYQRLLQKKKLWLSKNIKPQLTTLNTKEFKQFSDNIWDSINKVNLEENIYPYRNRSNLIIVNDKYHKIYKVVYNR